MGESVFDQVLAKAKKQKRRIGIGIIKDEPEIIASLKRAQELVEVVVYGLKIDGFECYEAPDKEAGPLMVRHLKEGKIDQFVRGQVDDLSMIEEYKKQFNLPADLKRVAFALMEDKDGWQFFLVAASNPDAQDLADKIRLIDPLTDWMKNKFNLEPKVAVMATCRPESVGKDLVMTQTYEEAEAVVKHLTEKGIEARNVNIELEQAKAWPANVLMAARGPIGNQIFRAMYHCGGGKVIICPTILTEGHIYEDDSRSEKDYYTHIVFAQALANEK